MSEIIDSPIFEYLDHQAGMAQKQGRETLFFTDPERQETLQRLISVVAIPTETKQIESFNMMSLDLYDASRHTSIAERRVADFLNRPVASVRAWAGGRVPREIWVKQRLDRFKALLDHMTDTLSMPDEEIADFIYNAQLQSSRHAHNKGDHYGLYSRHNAPDNPRLVRLIGHESIKSLMSSRRDAEYWCGEDGNSGSYGGFIGILSRLETRITPTSWQQHNQKVYSSPAYSQEPRSAFSTY